MPCTLYCIRHSHNPNFHCSSLNSRLGLYTPPKLHEQRSLYVCVHCRVSREFGRWKVNSLALEKGVGVRGSRGLSLPLDPEFQHAIRQLGRRPTLQTITESLIKKYGTHLLLSATLGGIVEYTELHNKSDSHRLMCFFLLKEHQFPRLCLPKQQRIKQFSGSLFFSGL